MTTSVATISDYQKRINHLLASQLSDSEHILHQAMRYSVLNGGKRLRPLLVYAAGEIIDAPIDQLDNTAMAVECIHAYSLIHDDLPAMDNDDYRRGQPSCHKKFDEATAILAGDALQSVAFEILSKNNNIKQMILLAKAIGDQGMVLGQSEDMNFKNQIMDPIKLHDIHRLKTGKLITASVQLGLLCGENSTVFKVLTSFAEDFGLAFQLRDDLLDDEYEENHRQHLKAQINSLFNKAMQSLQLISGSQSTLFQKIVEELLYEKN